MKKNKFLISSILLFLAIFSPVFVKAESVSYFATGYSYKQSEYGTNDTWVTYNANNNTKYNYQLPNSDEIEVVQFNFRISIGTGNLFRKGLNYIIKFDWFNDDNGSNIFSLFYNRMTHSLSCRESNWNTNNMYGIDCFSSESIDIVQDTSVNGLIHVTLRFTPIKDFFGLTMQNGFDNDPYTDYPSTGWEITGISYSTISDGTDDIINNQNQNTQNIINNQTNNTNSIISNQNQNTQDIIDNQNANSQAQIDAQRVCKYINKNNVVGPRQRGLNANGELFQTSSNEFAVTDYINIVGGTLSVESLYGSSNALHYCFYDNNKVKISCYTLGSLSIGSLTIPNNAVYFRSTIYMSTDVPLYKLCQNGNQAIGNSINDLNNSINDSSAPDTSGLSNAAGWLPPGPVDSLLTLPISFLSNVSNSLTGTCQPVNLPLPYLGNKTLTLPCVDTLYEQMGIMSFLNWIGGIVSAFILFRYLMRLYKWVDDTLTLRENTQTDWGGD